MNPTLAAMYDTNGYATKIAKERTKVAHLHKFAHAAAAVGIDLQQLSPEQAQALYSEFTAKLAEEEGVNPFADHEEPDGDEGTGEEGDNDGDEEPSDDEDKDEDGDEGADESPEEEKKEGSIRGLSRAKLAEADLIGRTVAHSFVHEVNAIKLAAAKGKTKKASKAKKASQNFELRAAELGIAMAKQANWNAQEAAQRIASVLEQGVPTSKVAHRLAPEQAVHRRALELLSYAGYPVNA